MQRAAVFLTTLFTLYIPAPPCWAQTARPATTPDALLLGRPAVDTTTLDAQRGSGSVQTFNLMQLDANLSQNVARNNVTGSNTVTNGAFANASGLSTVIQNSGNNVIIQNATILNLDIR